MSSIRKTLLSKVKKNAEKERVCKKDEGLYAEDENPDRGNWSGQCDFVLSMLGYSVGLGNLWRFPYLCYRNGGGVFLIPYLLTLAVVGIPMFYFETSIAQFSSLGTLHCWGFAPLFKGLGFGMVTLSLITSMYYNALICYGLVLLVSSFTSYLPWTDCDNTWNSPGCSNKLPIVNCSLDESVEYTNATCYNGTYFIGITNVTTFENATGIRRLSPSEEYFNNEILGISSGIDEAGSLQWKIVVGLMVAWIITFLCMIKGIKSTGKVVYVTATFPYLILTILLVRGLLLEGSTDGILYYITPKWEKLAHASVWRDGVTQIFYSMGMGWGGLHALASYNTFHHNTMRDALVSSVGACVTSIFAGFVIFTFIGAMSHSMGVEIDKVVASGPALAFIVYPQATTYMPCPPLWAILFFLMIVTLGLDSQFMFVETVITAIMDEFPFLRSYKTRIILGVCIVEFIIGLPLATSAGIYLLTLIDFFLGWICLPLMVLLEAVAMAHVYGTKRLGDDIRVMLGDRPPLFFNVCLMFVVPLFIPFVTIYPLVEYTRYTYGSYYTYPVWAEVMGWIAAMIPIGAVIVATVVTIATTKGTTFMQRIRTLLKPTRAWGPYLTRHRQLVDYVTDFVVDLETDSQQEHLPLSNNSKLVV